MCKFKSFIVTKTRVLWLPDSDNHEKILEANGITDNSNRPDFVRVELVPRGKFADVGNYAFIVDQDRFPDWWNAKEGEIATRDEFNNVVIASAGWTVFPGNLDVYEDATCELPVLASVGGDLYVRADADFQFPGLASVGGDLCVREGADCQLPVLASVGGDLYVGEDLKRKLLAQFEKFKEKKTEE